MARSGGGAPQKAHRLNPHRLSLKDQLRRIREASDAKRPAEYTNVMKRATEDLRASGAADRAMGPGDQAPMFELPRVGGGGVGLGVLLEQSPVVISFFRGRW